MKKTFAKLIATAAVTCMALTPMMAKAASYYPGYTCYYRDISGSCLNYQNSNPYFLGTTRSLSPYGNRRTLNSFNAYTTNQSPWDNRYSNRYNYRTYRFEEDDDDDYYDHYYGNDYEKGGWKYYYDEDDDTVRPYYLETDNDYHHYRPYNRSGGSNYYEYEHTRLLIH